MPGFEKMQAASQEPLPATTTTKVRVGLLPTGTAAISCTLFVIPSLS